MRRGVRIGDVNMTQHKNDRDGILSSTIYIDQKIVFLGVLYPPLSCTHPLKFVYSVHLIAASLQAFCYSFTSTEQICSARHERQFHTWHECSILHLKEHMTSNSTEIQDIRHSPVFHT